MTPNLIPWLSAPESIEERRARIAGYLVNEGYELPPSPPNYKQHVAGREPDFAYPVVGERASALQVAEGESEECTSEVDD